MVVISGITNIALNAILFKFFDVLGVAISFMVSYVVLLATSFIVNKWILKVYAPNLIIFIKPLIIFLPYWALSIYLSQVHGIFLFFLKAFIFTTYILIVALPYKDRLICLLRRQERK